MTYAARLVPALKSLCAQLTAAGVPASLDRATMKVPGAWVRPDTTSGDDNLRDSSSTGTARVSVLLVAPTAGDAEALADLARLLDKTLAVIDPDDDVDTSVVLPIRSTNHPAFRVVVDLPL